MMKLKPSLRNAVKPVLLFNLSVSIFLFLSGCLGSLEPTYKEEELPQVIKQICKNEFQLDVVTKRTPTTLWIYAPMSQLLHKDYGITQDKVFDEKITDYLRNILNTISRALINSNNTCEFYALCVSDINIGLDYTIMGSVIDIRKSYAGVIPWTESNKRYVVSFKVAPEAIGDTTGEHLLTDDIKLADFLAEEIAQRIAMRFNEEDLKNYFKVEKSSGEFKDNIFSFEYAIKQLSEPPKKIRVLKEILNMVAYCIKTYEFKDFSCVQIKDGDSGDKLIVDKAEILARPID